MVYFSITREGFFEVLDVAKTSGAAVWCGADAISQEEFERIKGGNVTRFVYPLADASEDVIADALSTIEEHHPGERIWIEHANRFNTSLEAAATRRSA